MTLTFDWFLPTSGDGRTIVGRGHSIPRPARPAHNGRLTSITSGRWPGRRSSSDSPLCSPRPAPGARMPGSPPPRWFRCLTRSI